MLDGRMQVNWTAVSAIIAGISALTAALLGRNTYRLARGVQERARTVTAVETVWHLDAAWAADLTARA
jgi:chromate transport protein ChrA